MEKMRQGGESTERRKRRARQIESLLREKYPSASVALLHSTPLQLLISVILSAQCTDARVNMVTPALFKKYKTVDAFAHANLSQLEREIYSTGFYRNKAKNIIECCKAVMERHSGEVPSSMDELIQLPGVGRKTANCVLSGAFDIASGIVVDTHVVRLTKRLGLTENSHPEKIESDLCKVIDRSDWIHFGNALIHHGRKICGARNPQCALCILNKLCPSASGQ